jgi:ABC-2 type transport system permease protein
MKRRGEEKEMAGNGLGAKWRAVAIYAATILRRMTRDRVALFFTILYPLIFLFIFGSIFSGSISADFHVVLINNSKSAAATGFVKALKSSNAFSIDESMSLGDAKTELTRGSLDAVIELPANFGAAKDAGRCEKGEKLKCEPAGEATVLYEPSSSSTGETVASVVDGIMSGMNESVTGPAPFSTRLEKSDDKGLSNFDYIFAGMLALAALTMTTVGFANGLPGDKKSGALRRVEATPFRPWQVISGSIIAYALISLVSVALVLICGVAFFHFHMVGSWFDLIVLTVLGVFVLSGIGAAIAGWARSPGQAQPIAMIVMFVLMFLSGMFFPSYIMPEWLQHVAAWLPTTPLNDGLRFITAQGYSLAQIWSQILELVGWGVVFYLIAFRIFRWPKNAE